MAETSGHIDPGALERSLQGLRKTARADALEEALADVLDAACLLFSISGTGLMVIDEHRALCYVAATDETGRALDEIQEREGRGPCVDAFVFDKVVQSRDLAQDERGRRSGPR
jgi:hypothetical protein